MSYANKIKLEYEEELKNNFIKFFQKDFIDDDFVSNKATTYILPMLGSSFHSFRSNVFPFSQFRGAFIGDNTHSSFDEPKILLVYRFSGKQEYVKFEEYLENLPFYEDKYEPDNYHVIYVFNIPSKWREDYNKFLQWKPSQFSKEYKLHICKFYNCSVDNPVYQTLYKSEERYKELENKIGSSIPRELEVSSEPYWFIEYYQEEFKRVKKNNTSNEY